MSDHWTVVRVWRDVKAPTAMDALITTHVEGMNHSNASASGQTTEVMLIRPDRIPEGEARLAWLQETPEAIWLLSDAHMMGTVAAQLKRPSRVTRWWRRQLATYLGVSPGRSNRHI